MIRLYLLALIPFFFAAAGSSLAATGGFSVLPMAPGDSTPFVVRVNAQGLTPYDSCRGKVWVYDRNQGKAISRIWADGSWRTGWFGWLDVWPDSTGEWESWVVLKVYEAPGASGDYYIKYRLTSQLGDTFEVQIEHGDGFQILDMGSEGGWLEGVLYSDTALENPYERIVLLAKGPSDSLLGGYESEDNAVEEGSPFEPGYFCVGVRAGEISRFQCRDLAGDSATPYFERTPPWVVDAGETTFVSLTCDLSVLSPILFDSEEPAPGTDVKIYASVFNRGNSEARDLRVFSFADANHNQEKDPGEEVDEGVFGHLGPQDTLEVTLLWRSIPEGVHSIFVQVDVDGDEHPENDKSWRTLRVGNPLGDLVLNELMYHPLSGDPEWIEILNRSSCAIGLENWTIEDEDSLNPGSFSVTSVAPGGFFLLVSDSASFCARHPDVACPVLTPAGGLPSLNDAGDRITLRNEEGVLIDRISYEPDWGGRTGVSLERINPDLPSQDPCNWGSCVSYRGGTPGETNSIWLEVIPSKESLSCSPRVFSPDGDGVDDRVAISYELPVAKAKVKLLVYDRAGRRVRVLLDQEESGGVRTVLWDGVNDNGRALPIGIYIVYLEAVSGREVMTAKVNCVLARKLR